MPKVQFGEDCIEVSTGTNLRTALIDAGLSPHNGQAKWVNCRGLGTCGTCAMELLKGEAPSLNKLEKWRLNFPPHRLENNLRLACQLQVEGPLEIRKHPGFWGEKK